LNRRSLSYVNTTDKVLGTRKSLDIYEEILMRNQKIDLEP